MPSADPLMTKLFLSLLLCMSAALHAVGATFGSDAANDPAYDDNWTEGDNGGTPSTFAAWDLNGNAGNDVFAGFFIGDSDAGGANINTGGESFGMFANPGSAFADAIRAFGTPLAAGQMFTFDLAANFRNGNKGFDLRDGSGNVIFNLNIGGENYTVSNVSSGGGQIFGGIQAENTIFSIQLQQTDATSGTWVITRGGDLTGTEDGTYSGVGTSFKFYINGTDNGAAQNNLYFNNLAITAVPEPSTVSLLVASTIFAGCFYAHRRNC